MKMSTGYYQKNKERFRKKVCKMYQNLSAEENNKKLKCGRERYKFFLKKVKSVSININTMMIKSLSR